MEKYANSIIVPSYNRAAAVVRNLRALERQTYKNFEVLVVVDGSTDGTAGELRKMSFDFAALRILEKKNEGRAKVRNYGAARAAGELLIFFDDDTRPSAECVMAHLDHHEKHRNSILTGNALEDYGLMKTDIQRYKASLSRRWASAGEFGNGKTLLEKRNLGLTAANLSIPKSLFVRLHGFDERLSDCEDYDLAARALKDGVDIYFDPNLIVWHDDFITCESYIQRNRDWARWRAKLKQINGTLYSEFKGPDVQMPVGLKRAFFSFFARKFWVRTIDGFNWLRMLPQCIRYRIYSYVIAGLGAYFPDRPIR